MTVKELEKKIKRYEKRIKDSFEGIEQARREMAETKAKIRSYKIPKNESGTADVINFLKTSKKKEIGVSDIVAIGGFKDARSANSAIHRLLNQGIIVRVARGRYRLNPTIMPQEIKQTATGSIEKFIRLNGLSNFTEIVNATGTERKATGVHLGTLVRQGKIKRVAKGMYIPVN
jgi:predicted transcriptional regulator of viral defense system